MRCAKVGSRMLCAFCQLGSCVSAVNSASPPSMRTRRSEPRTALSKRFSSHSSATRSAPETTTSGVPIMSSQKIGPCSRAIRIRSWIGASLSTVSMLPSIGVRGGCGIGCSLLRAMASAVLPVLPFILPGRVATRNTGRRGFCRIVGRHILPGGTSESRIHRRRQHGRSHVPQHRQEEQPPGDGVRPERRRGEELHRSGRHGGQVGGRGDQGRRRGDDLAADAQGRRGGDPGRRRHPGQHRQGPDLHRPQHQRAVDGEEDRRRHGRQGHRHARRAGQRRHDGRGSRDHRHHGGRRQDKCSTTRCPCCSRSAPT